MIEEIQVTPMSADDPSIQVSDVSYLPSGDGMKQIHVSLEHSTSNNETVTLQYKYKMNGPLFVSQRVKVSWSIGYDEEAQSINNIEISVKFPANMFSKIASSLNNFNVSQQGETMIVTFPTSRVAVSSYRPMFSANNLVFDSCQTYWYTRGPLFTIFGFVGTIMAIMMFCLGVKFVRHNMKKKHKEPEHV
ncbi:hypothetical protein C9374_004759 [Naegleria lovaniensis]|uniref:DUF2207 domain-containing protein n=1 Tax=Naegleria lovaniensis TaxID=51637 RepID=A0AA88GR48_NAELO|nr:uncharacterized protein C9374_004759 [Naegleria lovaniensis]KAG2382792.1 hypothetical protein C9374_004759 [Naegleria lovaniensis]